MIDCVQKLRLYLFGMQMAQLPLIMVGRAKIFKQNPGLGNVRLYELLSVMILMSVLSHAQLFFWIGLLSGFPLLAVGYGVFSDPCKTLLIALADT